MSITKKSELFSRLVVRYRRFLTAVVLVLLVLGWAAFFRLHLTTDVAALLPDRGSAAISDFRLLAKAPLARRIVLRLRAEESIGTTELLATVDKLAVRLQPPFFSQVIAGPGSGSAENLFGFALSEWPNLMNPADYSEIKKLLLPDQIEVALRQNYTKLLQPLGFLQKKMILADPFEFRNLILPRLISLNPVGKARVVNGHFMSADGRETMLLLATPIAITDFNGAKSLLDKLNQVLAEVVPAGIEPIIISGHLYTVANAAAIQRDMKVVISASLLALLLIFLIFMRRRQALSVFLIPVIILGPALALTGLVDGSVSAITIGFGAVLLGVTIDYGLHIYFSLAGRQRPPGEIVASLVPPLLGAGLTTAGAFSVQLLSALPGQRQLALFAIFGVLLALGLSLLLLPQFLRRENDSPDFNPLPTPCKSVLLKKGLGGRSRRIDRLVISVWLILLLLLFGASFKVDCVGDLRQINLVPESLRQAEKSLKSVWGEVRGRALVFATGPTLEEALQVNEKLYTHLRQEFSPAEIVSLAPVLPSSLIQARNRRNWRMFWTSERLDELRQNLISTGRKIGFSATAFTPFMEALTASPPGLSESYWRRTGFSPLLDALIEKSPQEVTIITLIPDRAANLPFFAEAQIMPGVRLVSPQSFSREVSGAVSSDLKRFIVLALIVVSLILLILLRNFYQALLALLPVLSGLLSMFGIMGALGISFNLFNLVAAILIIGVGVDYGIFMVYRLFRGRDAATEKAVLVSGLTTLAGFGVLVLARHPALNSIGLTVLLGVGGALPTVLWVLPALAAMQSRGE